MKRFLVPALFVTLVVAGCADLRSPQQFLGKYGGYVKGTNDFTCDAYLMPSGRSFKSERCDR